MATNWAGLRVGNNNAWCQDNELSWIDWDNADHSLLAFTRQIIRFRREHPVFRRRFFADYDDEPALTWFNPDSLILAATDLGGRVGPRLRALPERRRDRRDGRPRGAGDGRRLPRHLQRLVGIPDT